MRTLASRWNLLVRYSLFRRCGLNSELVYTLRLTLSSISTAHIRFWLLTPPLLRRLLTNKEFPGLAATGHRSADHPVPDRHYRHRDREHEPANCRPTVGRDTDTREDHVFCSRLKTSPIAEAGGPRARRLSRVKDPAAKVTGRIWLTTS